MAAVGYQISLYLVYNDTMWHFVVQCLSCFFQPLEKNSTVFDSLTSK